MEQSIDIFKIINGLYKTNALVTSLEIEDVHQTTELDKFCQENNCYYSSDYDNVLCCKTHHQPKFWIR